MKITAIIRNPKHVPEGTPCTFTVGDPTVAGGPTVKEILFCQNGYSNGPGPYACYVVKYNEIPEVSQIPVSEVVDVSVNPDAKKGAKKVENPEAEVSLPE